MTEIQIIKSRPLLCLRDLRGPLEFGLVFWSFDIRALVLFRISIFGFRILFYLALRRWFEVGDVLHPRLGFHRQAPDLDETGGRALIELVAFLIGGQAVAVQGIWRFSTDDGRLALE